MGSGYGPVGTVRTDEGLEVFVGNRWGTADSVVELTIGGGARFELDDGEAAELAALLLSAAGREWLAQAVREDWPVGTCANCHQQITIVPVQRAKAEAAGWTGLVAWPEGLGGDSLVGIWVHVRGDLEHCDLPTRLHTSPAALAAGPF
jgi:hypothetical protein